MRRAATEMVLPKVHLLQPLHGRQMRDLRYHAVEACGTDGATTTAPTTTTTPATPPATPATTGTLL